MNIPTVKSVPGAGSIIVNEAELGRVPRAVKVKDPKTRQAIEAAYRTMQLHLQSANSDPTAPHTQESRAALWRSIDQLAALSPGESAAVDGALSGIRTFANKYGEHRTTGDQGLARTMLFGNALSGQKGIDDLFQNLFVAAGMPKVDKYSYPY